jgi:MFS family permease
MQLYTPAFFAMAICNLAAISSYSSFFLFPLYIAERGGSPSDVGILMGAFTLSSVLFRPWISGMIDRFGRKRSFLVGSVVMILPPLFYLKLEGPLEVIYWPMLMIRVVHGIGIAVCATAAFTYAADIIPVGRLNEGIGMFGISGLTGLALGPMVSEYMIKHYGFWAMFSAASSMGLLALMVCLPLAETYRRDGSSPSATFLSVFRGNRILAVSAMAILFGFGLAATGNFLPPFAGERNLAFISIYYVSYSGAAVLTRVLGGRIADRIGESRTIPVAFILLFAGLLFLVFLTSHVLLASSGILMGCGHGFLYPALNALSVRNEPAANRGKATGIYTGSIDAGYFVGSATLGYIAEWSGYPILFLTASLACLGGYVVFRWRAPRMGFEWGTAS